jgi:uncharacterized protein
MHAFNRQRHAFHLHIMKNIFYNSEEARIRALWRILLQAAIAAGMAALLFAGIVAPLDSFYKSGGIAMDKDLFDMLMDIFAGILFTTAMLASIKIAGKYFDKKKLAEFGLKFSGVWFKECLYGFLTGALLMTMIFLFELACGFITIDKYFYSRVPAVPIALAFAYPVIKMLCVGFYEESLSRGYHITNITEGLTGVGKIDSTKAAMIAIAITSAMFGLFHIGNPNASAFGVINTIVAGVLLGTAFIITKQLAMPIGIHMSWNLFQGLVYGFPVSGDTEKAQIISTSQTGPEWVTGGAYGPEAGLTGLIAIMIGLFILFLFYNKSKKITALLF